MSGKETFADRCDSIARHVKYQFDDYEITRCIFHTERPCLLLLNNFNTRRFHCLFANASKLWKSYNITKSCDIPEHFYEMIVMNQMLGNDYVLPFAGHFRESAGYTVGMFAQDIHLYPPNHVKRIDFKEVAYAVVVFLCVICHRLGGSTPNLNQCTFTYADKNPVLCDLGSVNVNQRERLHHRSPHFNRKKWVRFMEHKGMRDVIKFLRHHFKPFFQNKKMDKLCILQEGDAEGEFDTETHSLICQSGKKSLSMILAEFQHLMPDSGIRTMICRWLKELEEIKANMRGDKRKREEGRRV